MSCMVHLGLIIKLGPSFRLCTHPLPGACPGLQHQQHSQLNGKVEIPSLTKATLSSQRA